MALQTITPYDPGVEFGKTLSNSLERLAGGKLQQLQQQGERLKYQQAISSIPGMKPEIAQLLSGISPEERKSILPNLDALLGLYNQPKQQAQAVQPEREQQSQAGTPSVGGLFQSPQQKQQKELLELKKESLSLKKHALEQEEIKPFITGHRENMRNAEEINRIATEMKQIAEEYGKDFPSYPFSLLPTGVRRNPKVRRYEQLAAQLITAKSNLLKGQPTNYKTQLLERGKVTLDLPLETQLDELNSLIDASKGVFDVDTIIKDIRRGNKGNLPRDIATLVEDRLAEQKSSQKAAQDEDFPPANEKFEEGSQWQTSNGQILEYHNGQWMPV
jgi:hypothetical protein